MITTDTQRFCPTHGEYIRLALCPIVATSTSANSEARERRGLRASGRRTTSTQDGANFEAFVESDPGAASPGHAQEEIVAKGERVRRSAPAVVAPTAGSVIRSHIDNEIRLVVAEPVGRRPGRRRLMSVLRPEAVPLPTAWQLVRDDRVRPVRACPHCCHPLPMEIDAYDPYLIAIVGHPAASKTTTVVALIDAVDRAGAEGLGVDEFAATEDTFRYIRSLGDTDPLLAYKSGEKVEGTGQGRHPPYEFRATLPPNSWREAKTVSVLLQDSSGEDLINSDYRTNRAASILWSDVILFVYNPQDSPKCSGGTRSSQAHLLNGIRRDLEMRLRGTDKPLPPLVIAVSKADLVPELGELSTRGRIGDEQAVVGALRGLDDGGTVDAVMAWPSRHWRLIAPQPEDRSGQRGVVELFNLLLAQLSR